MKAFKKSIFAVLAVVAGISLTTACSEANEYEDSYTDNPSWVDGYTDSLTIAHPQSLAGTVWVRSLGLKTDVYGRDVLGFVESVNFISADSVAVKMSDNFQAYFSNPGIVLEEVISDGTLNGNWTNESNSEALPYYEYTYAATTGRVEILKMVRDDKGNISKSAVFVGIVVSGKRDVITLSHFGDTPVQTYLVRQ